MRSAWLSALSIVAACGSSGGGDGIVTVDQFEALVEIAQCDRAVDCGIFPDRDTCRAFLGNDQRYQGLRWIDAAVAGGRIRLDQRHARACIDGLAQVSCQMIANGLPISYLDPYCRTAWVPSQKEGEDCFWWTDFSSDLTECEVGTFCAPPTDCGFGGPLCCAGVCVAESPPTRDVGETCDPSSWCRYGLACKNGVCTVPALEGDPCLDSCAGGLACSFQADGFSRCGPPPVFANEGESCSQTSCSSPTLLCLPTPSGDFLCTRSRGRGDSCDENGLAPCNPFHLFCHEGTCLDLPRWGESCDDSFFCMGQSAGVQCSVGVCTALSPDGAPCFGTFDCKSNTCTDGRCSPPLTCP